ncbi:MAG: MFS transporter [Halobacteria archaeon]|nr:MFS transporter [Halobacteria archaeon]
MDIRERVPESYVLKYYLYRGSMAASFTASIWYLYVLSKNVSYSQLAVVDSIWWGGLILFEIPTGYIGDRIGRKNSLIISSIMRTIALVAMAFAGAFAHFALIFAFWALASTFKSGTADAWLYDVLKAGLSEGEFARVRGRGNSTALVVSGITALAGGYIAEVSMEYAYLASAGVSLISLPILFSFPSSQHVGSNDEDDEEFTILDALPVIREKFTRPPLRSFVLYVGLFYGVYWGVNFFVQPISKDFIGLEISQIGWMYAGFTALSAVVSFRTDLIKDRVGIRTWFYVIPIALGILYAGVAFLPIVAIPVFFVMRAARNVSVPLANQYINDRTGSIGRATVLSTAGMVYHLTTIPFELGAGTLADLPGVTPIQTVGVFGGILVVGALVILTLETAVTLPGKEVKQASD